MWSLFRCACGKTSNCPQLRPDIWQQIERRSYSRFVCFECAERHLKRPLTSDDLERCPENDPFICMMGRWGGSFNQKPDWAERMERRIMSNLEDLKAALDKIAAETEKISGDTNNLLTQLANIPKAGMTPEQQAALDAAVASAQGIADKLQGIDDLVPDAPPPAG